jgi:hypothetical protein
MMEQRFGYDFSRVRVHSDAAAGESAAAIHAHAYAFGRHVVMGSGRYQPHNETGLRLLAHELAHVVQQGDASIDNQSPRVIGHPDDPSERAAERAAAEPAMGPMVIQRQATESGSAEQAGEPAFLRNTLADFCRPYPTRALAREAREYMLKTWLPAERLFGPEVAKIFEDYLNRKYGDSLTRRVFEGNNRVARAFATSDVIQSHQHMLLDHAMAKLASALPADLVPGVDTFVPVTKLLSPADINYPLNWTDPLSIPGHIAGGVGDSDAGPDTRKVSGSVVLKRRVDALGRTAGVTARTAFHFVVQDAFDFCPGNPGIGPEQKITTVLSRLEATGMFLHDEAFAYDVPFEVRFDGPAIEKDMPFEVVRATYHDSVVAPLGTPQPETPPMEPPGPDEGERHLPFRP